MIYKKLTHITMTDNCIDDVKTDGFVRAHRANIYTRQNGEFKIELGEERGNRVVGHFQTMESAIEKTIDLAFDPDIIISGTGKYAGLEVRFLSRAVLIALAKKLEVVE